MKRRRQSRPVWIRDDRAVSPEEIEWLKTPEGEAACSAMASDEPADTPAAIRRWRQKLGPKQVAAAWNQVLLRRAARAKFSRAEQMLFDRVGLEQASDEVVARHKARRFAGSGRVADLCCGIGGDTLAIASQAETVAVDWSPVRVAMAEHNAAVYGARAVGLIGDVVIERPEADAVHIDPDRRAAGPRRHDPEFSSPDLEDLRRIVAYYRHAAIKFSPGIDFASVPFDAEIELISHAGECKQAVAWTGRFRQAHRRATVLPAGESVSAKAGDDLTWPEPRPPEAGLVLYEPDASVIRAGLVGVVARRLGLAPIDSRIAYLLGEPVPPTALLTPFRVIDWMEFSARKARQWLARHDVGRLDIKTRGFAFKSQDLSHQLRPGGRRPAVLFLTRVRDRPTAILAERLDR